MLKFYTWQIYQTVFYHVGYPGKKLRINGLHEYGYNHTRSNNSTGNSCALTGSKSYMSQAEIIMAVSRVQWTRSNHILTIFSINNKSKAHFRRKNRAEHFPLTANKHVRELVVEIQKRPAQWGMKFTKFSPLYVYSVYSACTRMEAGLSLQSGTFRLAIHRIPFPIKVNLPRYRCEAKWKLIINMRTEVELCPVVHSGDLIKSYSL